MNAIKCLAIGFTSKDGSFISENFECGNDESEMKKLAEKAVRDKNSHFVIDYMMIITICDECGFPHIAFDYSKRKLKAMK